MPLLYRVFPYLQSARENEPGNALYIPHQGGGRIDNPASYSVLYLSDAPAGAIAETFGRFPEWTQAILEGPPSLPGSSRALACFHAPEDLAVCDLDDPAQLLELALRPSDVVSRDYSCTRAWALRIYQQRKWAGIRWWSYYDALWASYGLWSFGRLALEEVRPLRLDNTAFIEASRTISRRIIPRGK